MSKSSKNYRKKELKISTIEATSERLTGRARLAVFVAHLHQIRIFPVDESRATGIDHLDLWSPVTK